MTMIHFKDNSTANENKHDNGFKITPVIEKVNAAFQQFGVFGKYLSRDEMRWLSNPMVITAPDSPLMGN